MVCHPRRRTQLAVIFITRLVVGNLTEVVLPFLKHKLATGAMVRFLLSAPVHFCVNLATASVPLTPAAHGHIYKCV